MPWFPHQFPKRTHLPGLLGGLSKVIAAQTLGVESIRLKDSLSLSTPQAAMTRSHSSKFCGLPETECPQVLRRETPHPLHGSEFPSGSSGNDQTGTRRKRGQQGLHLPRNQQRRRQGRIRGVAQGTWASPHPGNLTPFPRLEESPEPSQRGRAQGPPQTLGPQNSCFLCRAEETKVIRNLSSPLLSPVSPGPGPQERTERSILVGILQKKQGNGWGRVPSERREW